MNYINILVIILLMTTLFVVGCSSDKEVPLAGDLGPSGGKVSLSIINPDADILANQTANVNETVSDDPNSESSEE